MMPRFRSRNQSSMRPIHRIKHVVDVQGATGVGVALENALISTADNPVIANTTEVETGSKVNGIYLVVEAYATSAAALSNLYLTVFKNPGNNLTMPEPNVIGASDNKRFVIHQEMVMLQQVAEGNPRTLFKGVIVIPRGYRRFGPDDRLTMELLSPGVTTFWCMQCHYKEFR